MQTDNSSPSSPSAEFDARMLDQALSRGLAPPALPADFRWRLMAAMQQDGLRDLAAQRAALQAEHQRLLQRERSHYLHLRRDTLVLLLAAAFTGGALAVVALPWLREATGWDPASLMPTLVGLAALASVLGAWWWRLRGRRP